MAKYKTEFKMKVVKEYLEGNMGCKELAKNTLSQLILLLEFGLILTNLKAMKDSK